MFSAQQLQNFAGKKRITQETFDDAVRENIEEFDMEPDEAVSSAISEFEAQGVDLSNIVTSAGGAADLEATSLGAAAAALGAALDATDLPAAHAAVGDLSDALSEACGGGTPEEARQAGAAALAVGAAPLAARALAAANAAGARDAQVAAAAALQRVLPLSADLRAAFREAGGTAALAAATGPAAAGDDAELAAACLDAAAVACVKDEGGKGAAMDVGLGGAAIAALRREEGASAAAVRAACALLSALTTADDDSLPSSRAFPNARALAKDGAAAALASALRVHATASHPAAAGEEGTVGRRNTLIALCTALRQVAANDEICQEAAAAGAVGLALQLADGALSGGDTALTKSSLQLVRQLASSDGVKADVVNAGGLDTIRVAAGFAAARQVPAMAEQALGLLAAVTLRNPEASADAAAGGCVAAALDAMRALLEAADATKGGRAAAALRQGCMALRNIAGRCPEEREGLLAAGAERVVRAARAAHPAACDDVGSAALRDFGLADYK